MVLSDIDGRGLEQAHIGTFGPVVGKRWRARGAGRAHARGGKAGVFIDVGGGRGAGSAGWTAEANLASKVVEIGRAHV